MKLDDDFLEVLRFELRAYVTAESKSRLDISSDGDSFELLIRNACL